MICYDSIAMFDTERFLFFGVPLFGGTASLPDWFLVLLTSGGSTVRRVITPTPLEVEIFIVTPLGRWGISPSIRFILLPIIGGIIEMDSEPETLATKSLQKILRGFLYRLNAPGHQLLGPLASCGFGSRGQIPR